MQRVTPGISNALSLVEKALRENFVPVLFEGLGEGTLEQGVTHLTVKQAVLALPDPTLTAPEKCTASCVITGHLVAELRGQVEFRMADNSACLREVQTAVWWRIQQRAEAALAAKIARAPVQGAHRLRWAKKTGAWLTVQPSIVNGTELGEQAWRDDLSLRYGLDPPDLPKYCDVCNAKFTICHALNCNRGGLVTARHNELRDGVADLDGKAFTPLHVRNDSLIFTGFAVNRPKDKPAGNSGSIDRDGAPPPEATEEKGDLLIRDL